MSAWQGNDVYSMGDLGQRYPVNSAYMGQGQNMNDPGWSGEQRGPAAQQDAYYQANPQMVQHGMPFDGQSGSFPRGRSQPINVPNARNNQHQYNHGAPPSGGTVLGMIQEQNSSAPSSQQHLLDGGSGRRSGDASFHVESTREQQNSYDSTSYMGNNSLIQLSASPSSQVQRDSSKPDPDASLRQEEVEIKSGWLFKKAESSWGWRKRWFVLYKSRLAYFSSPEARGVVKTIALNDPRVEAVVEALPNELEFRINSYGRSFHLKAVSDGERAQWIFALQLVIKDGMIAHEKYSELARRQQARKREQDGPQGYAANLMGGGSRQHQQQINQQARGMFSATQLKRKLAEALPWDASRGAPTPALSLSNPGSRDNSLHGSRDGSLRGGQQCRSLDVSQHNHDDSYHGGALKQDALSHGSRSRDGSLHGGLESWDPDDSGKRVRKDSDALTKTLSVAGQQAVELTMRYLAHMLLRGRGPFQVHEVVWVIHKACKGLLDRNATMPQLTSQFLTSVVLRGLLVKQQMGPDGTQWPEVHVNTESVEFHKFSQHLTHLIVGSLESNIEVAPEALVLPPILLPLLLLIEVMHQNEWPAPLSPQDYQDELISAVSALSSGNELVGPAPSSAFVMRGGGESTPTTPQSPKSSHTPTTPMSPMEPRSPGGFGERSVTPNMLQTSRSFQDLIEGMNQLPYNSQGKSSSLLVDDIKKEFDGGDVDAVSQPEDLTGILGSSEDIWDVLVDPDTVNENLGH